MSKKPRIKAAGLGFWPYLTVAFVVVAAYSVGGAWLAASERVVRAVMLGCVGVCAALALAVPLQKRLPTGVAYPDPKAIEAAAEVLLTARRPVIVAGGGAISANASDELTALAEKLGAAV